MQRVHQVLQRRKTNSPSSQEILKISKIQSEKNRKNKINHNKNNATQHETQIHKPKCHVKYSFLLIIFVKMF